MKISIIILVLVATASLAIFNNTNNTTTFNNTNTTEEKCEYDLLNCVICDLLGMNEELGDHCIDCFNTWWSECCTYYVEGTCNDFVIHKIEID